MVTRQWSPRHAFEFGPFQLQTSERLLLRDGQEMALTPKLFDVLLVLVENSGRIIEKNELLEKVWPDAIVEEGTLTKTVSMLRKILGDEGAQAYIETIPRRGYRFVAEVREVSNEPAMLPLQVAGETVPGSALQGEGVAPPAPTARPVSLNFRHRARKMMSRRGAALLVLLLVALATGVYYLRLKPTPPVVFKSIAVLPFKPLVADSRDESLELGMADTLITRLSNLQDIAVRPIDTVRKYSALDQDPVAAGREMNVDAVLDGHIQRSEEKIRITVRLLNARDGRQVWANQYDEKMTDIFSVQDSIATKVSAMLAIRLSSAERKSLTHRYTDNTEAYQAYLKGRYYTSKFTHEGFQQGLDYLNHAIALDPRYAQAYEGLAYCYLTAADWFMPPNEALPQMKDATSKALQLDNTLAAAHVWLGMAYLGFDRNWSAAENEFKRAIELDANDVKAHEFYSIYLLAAGRFDQAIAEARHACEIEPLSPEANTSLGMSYYFSRRYDLAINQLRFTIEIEPTYWLAYYHLGRAYMQKGQLPQALATLRKARESDDRNAQITKALGYALGLSGDKAEALKILDELNKRSKHDYVAPHYIAMLHFGLGDKDQGFAWLEKAYAAGSFQIIWFKVEPEYDMLRSDPRFKDLLKRLGPPQ